MKQTPFLWKMPLRALRGQSVGKKRIATRTPMLQDEILPSFRVGNCHYSHKGDSGAEDKPLKEGPKESSIYLG